MSSVGFFCFVFNYEVRFFSLGVRGLHLLWSKALIGQQVQLWGPLSALFCKAVQFQPRQMWLEMPSVGTVYAVACLSCCASGSVGQWVSLLIPKPKPCCIFWVIIPVGLSGSSTYTAVGFGVQTCSNDICRFFVYYLMWAARCHFFTWMIAFKVGTFN